MAEGLAANQADIPAGRRGLKAGGALFQPVAMGPNQVEDAAPGFNSRLQMVSDPPDQDSYSKRLCVPTHSRLTISREVQQRDGVHSATEG